MQRSLMIWAALGLFGCGGMIQAEDAETQALVARARQLYDAGDYAGAKTKAGYAVQRSADNPQALYLRGLAEIALEEYAAGRGDLEQARKVDPLLMFAKGKVEFEQALAKAKDNTLEALEPGLVETPPLEEPPDTGPVEPEPTESSPEPTDALLKALRTPGSLVLDESGLDLFTVPQRRALDVAGGSISTHGFTLKVVALAELADVEAEAKRLFDEADLDDTTILVTAAPGPKLGAYTPTVLPEVIKAELERAMTPPEASLAKRVILLASGLTNRLELPPPVPNEPAQPEPGTTMPESPQTPAPAPPAAPVWQPYAYGAGGVAVVLLAWLVLGRLGAKRRLSAGFRQAHPALTKVADRLTAIERTVAANPVRPAQVAHEAAILAFDEAAAMMHEATAGKTTDIGRVERAVRLLDEADGKLSKVEEALAAGGPVGGPCYRCYFTAKLIPDRLEADLVLLKSGDRQMLVLASNGPAEQLRRGQQPAVLAAAGKSGLVHWSRVPGFEPAYDLYHDDRHAVQTVPLESLAEPLFDDASGVVAVDTNERPDYTIEV